MRVGLIGCPRNDLNRQSPAPGDDRDKRPQAAICDSATAPLVVAHNTMEVDREYDLAMSGHDDRPTLRIGHSPDPDDAFMWWPLVTNDGLAAEFDTGRFRFEPVALDIEALNERSVVGDLEITALSCAQYPHVRECYVLTACGSSMGDNYGPRIVAAEPMGVHDLTANDVVIAVPGERTSAFAAANLMLGAGAFRHQVVAFDEIIAAVVDRRFAAGIVIHEGQITFEQAGLHLVADLGQWWTSTTGLPLPLGVNAIRRDLDQKYGAGAVREVTATLRKSLAFAMEHRSEALTYALKFGRGLSVDLADEFVRLYVNRLTFDFGPEGIAAVERFLGEVHRIGLCPDPGLVLPVEPAIP